jgi:hypothetical protein
MDKFPRVILVDMVLVEDQVSSQLQLLPSSSWVGGGILIAGRDVLVTNSTLNVAGGKGGGVATENDNFPGGGDRSE